MYLPWLGSVPLFLAGEGADGGRARALELLRFRGRVEQPDGCFGEEEAELRASGLVPELEPEVV